jgi:surface antigen
MEEVMRVRRFALVSAVSVALAASLGACSQNGYGYGTKEVLGTLGGAALGGYVASALGGGKAATAGGAVLGGILGNYVGRGLDHADQLEAERTAQYAFEYNRDGQQQPWSNPNSGNSGYTMPTNTYQGPSGDWCRQYQTSIVVEGRAQTGTGTACRQPDGTWQIVS